MGISFSTRMVGLAVVESGSLIDYSVKLYKEKWSSAKMQSILTSLTSAMKHFAITHIVLSIPPMYYQSDHFNELWQEMTYRLRKQNIPVSMIRQSELQVLVGNEERLTRRLLSESIARLYPELEFYARLERRNKVKYYYKMFEAIGAAILQLRQLK